MDQYLKVLGHKVRDTVSGFEGVATSVCFDLYGCIQVAVHPLKKREDDKLPEGQWFDEKRLKIMSTKPVMKQPNFGNQVQVRGPSSKPAACGMSVR